MFPIRFLKQNAGVTLFSIVIYMPVIHYFVTYPPIFHSLLFCVTGVLACLCLCLWLLLGKGDLVVVNNLVRMILFIITVACLLYWLFIIVKDVCKDCNEKSRTDSSSIDHYFESIRDNEAMLTAFFTEMPKGGDLHNHYSGSVYAESYIDAAILKKMWVNLQSLKFDTVPPHRKLNWKRIDQLNRDSLADLTQRVMQEWSVKDYYDGFRASDKHFFDAFKKFVKGLSKSEGLMQLKQRAVAENVQYLEIMTGVDEFDCLPAVHNKYRDVLRTTAKTGDTIKLFAAFENLYQAIHLPAVQAADKSVAKLTANHIRIDDSDFHIRYLLTVSRDEEPVDVFKSLVSCFEGATKTNLVVGVNILTREDGAVAMKDYSLHMRMFQFMHQKYPGVKYSMHAGELTLGTVVPEDLATHIHDAIFIAGADRIGHGVDLPYELNSHALMKYMHQHEKAVEINLVSNEFILKVKGSRHPLMLYALNKVPVVISTDDAGILRTNLTEQFVLLAKRYPTIHYHDIRGIIENSIHYSFIKEPLLKDSIQHQLVRRMDAFENEIMQRQKN